MFTAVKKEMKKKFDIVILAAAASDYVPTNTSKSKIKSTAKQITVKLQRVPKIIDQIKKIQKDVFLIGFKAETNLTKKNLQKVARKKLIESKADMIVANDVGTKYKKNPEYNDVQIVFKDGKVINSGWMKKIKISKFIRKQIEKKLDHN